MTSPELPGEDTESSGDIISLRIAVPPMCDGWRLDHFLKWRIDRLSRTRIQAVIAEQITFTDGRRVRPSSRVRVGEVIHLDRPAPPEPDVPRYFDVLAEDEHFIAIDKPAGLPMHTSAKFWKNTLTAVLRERYPNEAVQICHRLDRETSGVLLVARNVAASAFLMQAFEHRRVQKAYLALVHGRPEPATGVVDASMKLLDTPTHLMMGVVPGGLPARTKYTTVESYEAHALLLAEPETGRQHQIRVHCAHMGHPIVGDKLYRASEADFMAYCDDGMTPELLAKFDGLNRHALHAHRLTFPHPISKQMITVQSPLPPDLRNYINGAVSPKETQP
ncbi:MAG: RluA family pseudouridine synthase [Deltaproteobacteria bacterium]|nr:RluA family pseudouridine synthase [Deltaproteobacteria bacterium]